MSILEQIVRPFESPKVINDKKTKITKVKNLASDRAIIRWGSAGEAPETKQIGIKVIVKGQDVKKAFTQVSKKTTDIRIENPSDASQFVEVRRIDEIKFRRPKPFVDKRTGQPSNIAPGLQTPDVSATAGSKSNFSDGSTGTTSVKSDSGITTTFVNGNTNAVAESTAGTTTTLAEKHTETSTFILKWDDVA